MRIDCYCGTGAYHESKGETCQDVVESVEVGDYEVVVVADGVTACANAAEGAIIACKAFEDFIAREQGNIFRFSDKKLAYLLMEHILYFLETESGKQGLDLQNYASTIIGAVIEKKSGKSILFNLGDGTVFELGTYGMKICMPPKRHRGNPCLTTTKDAYKAVEIKRTDILMGEGLLLCTDGFTDIYNDGVATKKSLMGSIASRRWDELKESLKSIKHVDDCSYVVLIRDRK